MLPLTTALSALSPITLSSPIPILLSHHSAPYGGYVAWPINFISCQYPNFPTNSSFLTEINTQCASNSSQSTFDYIKVGRMRASEVPHMCSVDLMAFTSWEFRDLSLSEIHQSLLYGFELYVCSWWWCSKRTTTNWEKFTNWLLGTNGLLLLIPLAILGVSLPVTIIIGLIGVLVLSLTTFPEDFCFTAAVNILVAITVGFAGALVLSFVLMENFTYSFGVGVAPKFIFTGVISSTIICAPRIIIGPFAVWFLIYKFRRRRYFTYDAIESYLQGDNKLVPIRYSYSDLKRRFSRKTG
ncbi:uncharacterized protein LOC121782415 isoform X4 [Salvia splendens]|uniref:uncharacterized protein LOC121782415 isoform X4 n=1 Tax=Salvia splendens TaxID=180675 RepID=UPI001C26F17A|nr:uncharacterized protein LOC121782415 isoform X4 [Salvia splendens]